MKKYDLMIAGIYVLITIIALFISFNFLYSQNKAKRQAAHYMEALHQKPIRVVTIRQTDLPLTVVSGKTLSEKGKSFKLQGVINAQDIYHCKVVGDTLVIEGEWNSPTDLILYVAPGIQVDTMGAPRVRITTVNTQTE